MKALVYDGTKVQLTDRPRPRRRAGEARIRVSFAGLCATDREIARGYMDFRGTLGHEFVGVVEHASASQWEGRRVVGEINLACRKCAVCRVGRFTHCPRRRVLGILNKDGACAEYLTLPLTNLHHVPDNVSDEAAVFTEPLAAACEILDQIPDLAGARALVLGDGKLGLLVAWTLQAGGAVVTVAGHHPIKGRVLRGSGISYRDSSRAPLPTPPPRPWDIVVDCTGSPSGLAQAFAQVQPRGTVVMKSTVASPPPVDTNALVINEITLLGSRCGPFPRALELLKSGAVDPRPLITAVHPLADAEQGFRRALKPDALKVLIQPTP